MKTINDFKCVFKMQLIRGSGPLVFYTLIQIFMSLGIVIGFTYLFEHPDNTSILYLATGAPTLILIITGLVLTPQVVGTAKVEGYVDFIRTWPVKRFLVICADTLIWFMITIPGLVISTIIAHLLFRPGYAISWTIIPGFTLIALTSIGVGYGFSYSLPKDVSLSISQVIAFGSLMFSPLNFPIERLPEWLQVVHRILPLHAMAQVMRSSMASTTFTASIFSYLNLMVWCVLGFGGAIFILNKK